jgi:lincosamide nucleotidyltransferase A/C/D/E
MKGTQRRVSRCGTRRRRAWALRTRYAALLVLRAGYRGLKASPVRFLVHTAPLLRLRSQVVIGMRGADVLDVLEILSDAGARAWLVGGWGVDALVGRQTREHDDVDVAIERRFLPQAVRSLEGAGFAVVQPETVLPAWMPRIVKLRDAAGRNVELMPVDVPEPPPREETRPEAMRFRYTEESITTGTVDGRAVPCLAPMVQVKFHTGYASRDADRRDVRTLVDHLGVAAPPEFQ